MNYRIDVRLFKIEEDSGDGFKEYLIDSDRTPLGEISEAGAKAIFNNATRAITREILDAEKAKDAEKS
jgi:hypothetical protein